MPTDKPFIPIWGCDAISKVIGRTKRQTYHLLETGNLPAKKIGQTWASEEHELKAAILSSAGVNDATS